MSQPFYTHPRSITRFVLALRVFGISFAVCGLLVGIYYAFPVYPEIVALWMEAFWAGGWIGAILAVGGVGLLIWSFLTDE